MSASTYTENAVLNHLFGKAVLVAPAMHVALSTADPGEDGLALAEPVAGGYARVATTESDWEPSTAGVIRNAVDFVFPEATSAWGLVSHFALFDRAIASHAVAGVTTGGAGSAAFSVSGDVTSELAEKALLRVHGSTGNDGIYTVAAGFSYDGGADRTTVPVEEAVGDATVDGTLQTLGHLVLSDAVQVAKQIEAGDMPKFGMHDLEITAD